MGADPQTFNSATHVRLHVEYLVLTMFWGLALESGKRYAKTVESPFRISQAVLDTSTADNEIVRVMVDVDDTETILCNLSLKHGILQCPLDLQFLEGENIALYAFGGTGQVHLSGYILPEEEGEDMSFLGDEEEEEVADEEDLSSDEEVPELVAPSTSGKRKPDTVANPIPTKKTKIADVESVKPTKVTVCEMIENAVKDKDEDDDDEEDDDYDEEEGSDEDGEEEEDESDDEEMEDEDAEDEEEADAEKTPKAEVKTPKAEVKAEIKEEVKTPKAEVKTPKAEVKTPKAEVKAEIKEKSGSDMDTSISEVKSPKKEKKKKKRESLAINGEAPQTPVLKKEEKQKQDELPKTPKQKDLTLDKTPGKLDKTPKAQGKIETPGKSPTVSKAGGVLCEDITVGAGQEAKNGRMVSVYYEGRLKSNNKMFDSTLKGPPFKFRLGSGEVIKGWDVGVNGMKIGGKRRVVCPPHMAYGKRGAPPDIPKNAHLTFTIELKGIN